MPSTTSAQTFRDRQQSVSGTPGDGDTFDVVSKGSTTASGMVAGTFALIDHAVISPGGTLRIDRAITNAAGTIAIRIDAAFVEETETTESVVGRWVITSGTGVYAGLAGSGSYTGMVEVATHTVDGTLDGSAGFGWAG